MFRPVIENKRKTAAQRVSDVNDSMLEILVDRAVEFELLATNISCESDEDEELQLLLRKASRIIEQRVERFVMTHHLKSL
ncbi:hypothetical protein I4436_02555 [Pseudomonas qingdaonensis]|jgi:hypothetical protein|uniref:hypothetical protein n=1 Tax=Pseudomonas qingdaonensis TaxID=2056231 RepID=UPI0018C97B58|nr:hypothetical protein [Pseudomonas qingdaonensis]MBG8558483.1 hypothetical protein [Pseudomonas qingdaonensis]